MLLPKAEWALLPPRDLMKSWTYTINEGIDGFEEKLDWRMAAPVWRRRQAVDGSDGVHLARHTGVLSEYVLKSKGDQAKTIPKPNPRW